MTTRVQQGIAAPALMVPNELQHPACEALLHVLRPESSDVISPSLQPLRQETKGIESDGAVLNHDPHHDARVPDECQAVLDGLYSNLRHGPREKPYESEGFPGLRNVHDGLLTVGAQLEQRTLHLRRR